MVFVHRCLSGACNTSFSDYFQCSRSFSTRGSSARLLSIPFWPGPTGRSTLQFRASLYWNQLPASLRAEEDLATFHTNLKLHDMSAVLVSAQ